MPAPSRAADEAAPSFVRDVVPVLTKAGCNAGACHGSFQGQGGFRLSLLGFDPAFDHMALTQEARGRRVFAAAPAHSLLLRKPSGQLPHAGGVRLAVESAGYRRLHDWIARGAAGPSADDPRLLGIEVSVSELTLSVGQSQVLRVTARWSDEEERDVSDWALYDTTKDHVAAVGPSGTIQAEGPGRAAVMVRYLDQFAVVEVNVPYGPPAPSESFTPANFIDEHLLATWNTLGLTPAPLADDAEFLRRVYLDLLGTLPTAAEAREFLASTDPQKRARLIDGLLARPEFVDYWALRWGDLLKVHRRGLGNKGLHSTLNWLRDSLRENKPLDQFARELLLAQGNLYSNGAVAYYFIDQTPEDLAETTAQVFLGVRIGCAKCHHHPFEVWSQDDYHGLAAFFAPVQRKDTKEGGAYGGAQSIQLNLAQHAKHPETGQRVLPRLLGRAEPAPADLPDPRTALADWITAGDNPYFSRNLVNRVWGAMLGRGLLEPIDDFRATNPPAHPDLLDALAEDFVRHGFDLKHLIRRIANSRTYQLAADWTPQRDADGTFFTHRVPRRLPAEVLLDAVNQVCGVWETFDKLPAGTRAVALPDPSVPSYFLETFGRPKRTNSCVCERRSQTDLTQVLHLANGAAVQAKIAAPQGRLKKLLDAGASDEAIVEELYLAALSRLPDEMERQTVGELLSEAPSREEGFQDLLWVLLNTAEFAFGH